jgi:transcriptional regulator with XRE-family HTH domain
MIGCPNSVTISRWENGFTFPNRHYRKKLCELYGKDAAHLGLGQDGEEDEASGLTRPVFLFNEPLPEPEEMYGRKRERERLLARIAHKASTSITGPRRIGKTWLMQYLCLIVPKRLGLRFRVGYLDGMSPHCKTVAGFAAEALRRLGLSSPEVSEGLVSLDRGLQELPSKKLVPVLCIDEFERFSQRPEFTLDFFEGLRAMTHTSDLVLVIASKDPLHLTVSKNAQGSPFFNIFEQLLLKPFPYTDAEQFIQEKSKAAGFTPQERDYLWKYGRASENENAWLPLRLQLAGQILSEDMDQARRDPNYKQSFEEQFKMKYEAVMY